MLEYNRLLGRLFPGYRFAEPPSDIPDYLYVTLPSGHTVPFQDLSSGEKEVFFILSFFLRNNVQDAVVVVDEPELHLHPELGRLLVRTMQEIRPGNQLWVATHSGEIIDEAGRDRIFFLHRNENALSVGLTPGTEEPDAVQLFRDIFGFSGFLGVARAMVFTEGSGASLDRKVFGRLFSTKNGAIRIIPAGSSDSLARINTAILQLLNTTFSACEFFLIRDRDYLTDREVDALERRSDGRLWVLKRNQIENYLLDPKAIATVESEILDSPCTQQQAERALKKAARRIAGETLRDMLSFRVSRILAPQDFSLGKLPQSQECVDEYGQWHESNVAVLRNGFERIVSTRIGELSDASSVTALREVFDACLADVEDAIGGDGWQRVFPGKRLLEVYAKVRGHPATLVPALKNSLVRHLSSASVELPDDLTRIIGAVVRS